MYALFCAGSTSLAAIRNRELSAIEGMIYTAVNSIPFGTENFVRINEVFALGSVH